MSGVFECFTIYAKQLTGFSLCRNGGGSLICLHPEILWPIITPSDSLIANIGVNAIDFELIKFWHGLTICDVLLWWKQFFIWKHVIKYDFNGNRVGINFQCTMLKGRTAMKLTFAAMLEKIHLFQHSKHRSALCSIRLLVGQFSQSSGPVNIDLCSNFSLCMFYHG